MSKQVKKQTEEGKDYNVLEALVVIQSELNAPKNRRNSFGGFNYRSAEDILNAVKPLLRKTNTVLTISDEIKATGDKTYIQATATLTDIKGESKSTTAYAREEESKKGMDSAQVSGSTSSYARKYALNGLFAIDDSKDPDSDEYRAEVKSKEVPVKVAPKAPVKAPLTEKDPKIKDIIEGLKLGTFTVEDIKKTRTLTAEFEKKLKGYEKK